MTSQPFLLQFLRNSDGRRGVAREPPPETLSESPTKGFAQSTGQDSEGAIR